jgi:membrane protease YdiL (CAAX protease family)
MFAILSIYRRFIITGILVFFSIGFLGFFSESDHLSPVLQRLIVSIIFFLVIPLLYSKMVVGEPLKNMGLQRGNFGAGIFASILSLMVALGIIVGLVLAFPTFHEGYTFPVLVQRSFFWFVFYELVLVSLLVLLYEVFFRGLIQLFWLRGLGVWAVLIQTAIFYGMFFFSNDISWQKAPLLIFCPLAGFIAQRSQSLWYSLGASWLFLFLTDVFFLIYR